MEMDDNENFLDFQKMNFSPFTTQFTGTLPNAVSQFGTAKFAQNITTANGQVVGLVSGGEGGVHYLQTVDSSTTTAFASSQTQTTTHNNMPHAQTLITLPITMPGAKPGDAQQTVQIQVVNPNPIQHQTQKFQMGQMQIPIQGFQQGTTVLTVAYSPQEGEILHNHGLPEGMTVVAAIQPQDLQLLAQAQQSNMAAQQRASGSPNSTAGGESSKEDGEKRITIKTEPIWQNAISTQTPDLAEYITTRFPTPINLHQFLKFNSETIKRESMIENSPLNNGCSEDTTLQISEIQSEPSGEQPAQETATVTGKVKKKRKQKKKPPKPKKPKPGQVHIATALDGTILFCCPECHMAYPEKENLEQHLSVHKIERRFICDICGAGLKRKEHLERHKLGHNPDRPYICSVCMKGFKRKEHLNLHFVIHSGEKTEICNECGKGFYRKDHLRKHAKSHAAKRLKEEMSAQTNAATNAATIVDGDTIKTKDMSMGGGETTTSNLQQSLEAAQQQQSATLCLPEVTIHVPTSNNTTLPVQIQMPQLVATSNNNSDGTNKSMMVLRPPSEDSIVGN